MCQSIQLSPSLSVMLMVIGAASADWPLSPAFVATANGHQSPLMGVFVHPDSTDDASSSMQVLQPDALRWRLAGSVDDCSTTDVQAPKMPDDAANRQLAIYADLDHKCQAEAVRRVADVLEQRWQSLAVPFTLVVSEPSLAASSWLNRTIDYLQSRNERAAKPPLRLFVVTTEGAMPVALISPTFGRGLFRRLSASSLAFSTYLHNGTKATLQLPGVAATSQAPAPTEPLPAAVPRPASPNVFSNSPRKETDSGVDGQQKKMATDPTIKSFSRTSVLFVSISFIILMIISLAWLVFYYVQRFRYAHAKDRLARRLFNAARKALAKIPTKPLAKGDVELEADCPVCIEPYHAGDVVRVLPCRHIFHKTCVDPWLLEHRTCPMCKTDILKSFGFNFKTINDTGAGGAGGGTGRGGGTGGVGGSAGVGGGGLDGGDLEGGASEQSSDDGRPSSTNGSSYGNYPYPGVGTDSDTHDPFSFSPGSSPTLVQQVIHQGNVHGFSIIPLTVHSAVVTRPASTGNLITGHDRSSDDSLNTTGGEAHLTANKSHHSAEVHHPPVGSIRTGGGGLPMSLSSTSAEDAGSEASTPTDGGDVDGVCSASLVTTANSSVTPTPDSAAAAGFGKGPDRPRSIFKPVHLRKGVASGLASSSGAGGGGIAVSLREVKEVAVEPAYAGLTPLSKMTTDASGGASSRSTTTAAGASTCVASSAAAYGQEQLGRTLSSSAVNPPSPSAVAASISSHTNDLRSSLAADLDALVTNKDCSKGGVVAAVRPVTSSTFHGKGTTKRGVVDNQRITATTPATIDKASTSCVSHPSDFGSLESL